MTHLLSYQLRNVCQFECQPVMDRPRNPFTCYFCHKKIENDTEMGHTSVCGNVLVPCPHKCGSYLPRIEMPTHRRECVNRPGRSMTKLTSTEVIESYEDAGGSLDRRHNSNGREVERLQHDFQKLAARMASCEMNSRGNQNFDKVAYQNQMILEWKKVVDFKLDTIQQTFSSFEKDQSENEFALTRIQQKLMLLDKLQMDINLARDTFLQEQNYNRQANLEFAKNLDEFKELLHDSNTSSDTLFNDQKRLTEQLRQEIDAVKQSLDEQKTKNISVIFDIKTISQIASDTAEKLEIQERLFTNFREDFDQMRLDLEFLENLASADARTSAPGHLVWKLTNFQEKLSKSKESNLVYKSPIFYTHDFGYKLLVYLNGLKKWKDRYALISVHVLKGDYDALLKWPCCIEGTVLLRDQENAENPKNFSKHVVAKRQQGDEENEEPQESTLSYIFIPHSTLTKSCYLKNDEVYFEVRIEQNRKLLTETTL